VLFLPEKKIKKFFNIFFFLELSPKRSSLRQNAQKLYELALQSQYQP